MNSAPKAMKITTWNINGLRSAVRGDFENWLQQSQDDIVCLQEAKVEEDLLTANWFAGYQAYLNPAQRKGYSGVLTLVRSDLEQPIVSRGITHASDAEGRVITTEFSDFTLLNIYAPHSHRQLTRLDDKVSFLGALSEFIQDQRQHGKPLILAGDFNIAHAEIDLSNPRANMKNAGFLPQERQWATDLLSSGFIDAFRHFEPGGGHYTWWSMRQGVKARNIGWRLDYIFVEEALKGALSRCWHQPDRNDSDHCPVTLELAL